MTTITDLILMTYMWLYSGQDKYELTVQWAINFNKWHCQN